MAKKLEPVGVTVSKRSMTKVEAQTLLTIKKGADIWGYVEAKILRTIQREVNPDYIWIGKAVDAPKDGAERQPYFGAIATKLGLEAAKEVLNG